MKNFIKESSTNQENKRHLSRKCAVNDTLTLIGKRWLMTILYEVSMGNDQFSSLRKNISGISDHILSLRIDDLVKNGLIVKNKIKKTIPPQIAYIVTAKGKQLLKVMDSLNDWGHQWHE